MPRCVVVGCNNNGNHSFPKDLRLKKLWEKATKIRNFTANQNSRICSKHFKETDYQGICDATGLPQVHRHLKKTAIPSIFSWNKKKASTPTAAVRVQRYLQRSSVKELFSSTPQRISFVDVTQVITEDTYIPEEAEYLPAKVEVSDLNVPDYQHVIEETTADLSAPTPAKKTTSTQTPPMYRLLSGDNILSNAKSVFINARLEKINKFNLYLIEAIK